MTRGLGGFMNDRLVDNLFPLTPALSLGERESRRGGPPALSPCPCRWGGERENGNVHSQVTLH